MICPLGSNKELTLVRDEDGHDRVAFPVVSNHQALRPDAAK